MNQPFIIKLPKIENKDLKFSDKNENALFSPVLPYPLMTLGFHCFIHRTRSAMEITEKLQTKTGFYYVVNPFEPTISNFEDNITNSTKSYFKGVKDIDGEFLNLWEILFIFDILHDKTKNILIKSNADIINLYKDKFSIGTNVKMTDSNLDLMIFNTVMKINNINFIEQEYYKELISYLINILNNQVEGGHAVIKYYDSFCIPTLKLIHVISSFYKECYIYKPFISRHSDSERYLILKGFIKTNKDLIKILEGVLKSMDTENYICDIFPDIELSREYIKFFTFVNTKLVNNQQIMINEIIIYIKENNYFGDKYHIFRDKQIESSKWWIRNFYPPSENIFEKNKQELEKLYKATQEKLNLECEKFIG